MEIRDSVRVLKTQGHSLREISRLLKLSRNRVRRITGRGVAVRGIGACERCRY
jgi:DNA-directed RNA polymerase sigma subunit (sigma70/sigma32)